MTATRDHAQPLTLDTLREALADGSAALRLRTRLQPAGGPGDKLFPPTYEGGRYAIERRRVGDREVDTVLLDSVQSQANRMESALLQAHDRGELRLPVIAVDFSTALPHIGRITSLDAPHRIADAILRESLLAGTPFRDTEVGRAFIDARISDATSLFELCPTALVFGIWDSTGPKGGLGAKFARALVSEIVGLDAVVGVRTASRIDPLPIQAVPIYQSTSDGWTPAASEAQEANGKPVPYQRRAGRTGDKGKPSEINLGNVMPTMRDRDTGELLSGGVTVSHALQTTVLSLPALRRLRFPAPGQGSAPERDGAARAVLAALAVAAIAVQRREGYDLRSRCVLVPEEPAVLEVVAGDGGPPRFLRLDAAESSAVLGESIAAAREVGLPWRDEEIVLEPAARLVELVRRSEALAAHGDVEAS